MPDSLHDALAAALQEIANTLNGYKNCPAMTAMTVKAAKALRCYNTAKRAAALRQRYYDGFQLWLRANYPDLWGRWLNSATRHCIAWANEHCREVREEYVLHT